ncbi:RidA family protein [Marinicella sp. S1101]|uniref:RidA family protein n=1 Tax=Marinicella marina TaxID=2996016 RepID=UPI002260B560|nr:RidA family protein [Marinicella marina]MCX7552312.1 RidA family protein [Marinicella marina]MDJ1139187.1 RidA family protein [Marinicella marina]
MNIKRFNSGSEFENRIGYSRAVDDGRYVFVSGTTGYDYQSMQIESCVKAQTIQCFKNIELALKAVEVNLIDVLRVRYILADADDFEACWPIMRQYLGQAKPAATLIIADLMNDEIKIEIEVMATSKANNN